MAYGNKSFIDEYMYLHKIYIIIIIHSCNIFIMPEYLPTSNNYS